MRWRKTCLCERKGNQLIRVNHQGVRQEDGKQFGGYLNRRSSLYRGYQLHEAHSRIEMGIVESAIETDATDEEW